MPLPPPLRLQLGLAALLSLTGPPPGVQGATRSPKRGLIFIPSEETPEDNGVWVQKGSSLTWYYNYHETVSPAFAGIDQDRFEFVPMMWGILNDDDEDTSFLESIKALSSADEVLEIEYVLAFNEPDEPMKNGGSDIDPKTAAKAWALNLEPLRKMGFKVGLPAVTGSPRGIKWMEDFLDECKDELGHDCEYDFVPAHWYGPFEYMAAHIGERMAAHPKKPIWVTEFGYPNQDLLTTQDFFNKSLDYLDDNDSVERYSYFGSFRSQVSNVGPNMSFLNKDGELTDIGSWYLGGNATGVDPESGNDAIRGLRASLLASCISALLPLLLLL